MNDLIKLTILAIVQGITEFLPVSSSGHLVLMGRLIGLQTPGNMTEVILHTGTFLSVLIYFRKKLLTLLTGLFQRNPADLRYIGALAAGSVPLVIVYLTAGNMIESFFDKPMLAAIFICITGLILLSLLFCKAAGKEINWTNSIVIGIAQALALLPGISRSGSTIVAARHMGVEPEKAAEFSFLMSLPAMAGAVLIKSISLIKGHETINLTESSVGIIVSAVTGYAALVLLLKIIRRGRLWLFGIYCLPAGIIFILLLKYL